MINGFWGRGTLPPALLDVDVRIGSKSKFTIVRQSPELFLQSKKELRRFSHNSKFTLAKVALKSAQLGAGGGGHFDILWVKCSQEV